MKIYLNILVVLISYRKNFVVTRKRFRISNGKRAIGASITKTCLYNVDSLKSQYYIVKLEFTWVLIIVLISAQNIDCGYSLNRLGNAVLTSTHNLCFEQKCKKYPNFYLKIVIFLVVNFSVYFKRLVLVMQL